MAWHYICICICIRIRICICIHPYIHPSIHSSIHHVQAYQLINRITPKAVRRRIQLRDKHGQPLGPVESHAALVNFVRTTWADPQGRTIPEPTTEITWSGSKLPTHCMPFTLDQLQTAIRKLKWNKAVAAPFAPGSPTNSSPHQYIGWAFTLDATTSTYDPRSQVCVFGLCAHTQTMGQLRRLGAITGIPKGPQSQSSLCRPGCNDQTYHHSGQGHCSAERCLGSMASSTTSAPIPRPPGRPHHTGQKESHSALHKQEQQGTRCTRQ